MEPKQKIGRTCECMCYVCGKGDKYYKGCSCKHECCRVQRAEK